MSPQKQELDSLSVVFMALANPTRRKILELLRTGEITVMDLAKPFDMSLPAITKHLKILERAGLISRSQTKQYRPSKLDAEPLKEAASWINAYRQFWNHSFDRMEAVLDELQMNKEEQQNDKK